MFFNIIQNISPFKLTCKRKKNQQEIELAVKSTGNWKSHISYFFFACACRVLTSLNYQGVCIVSSPSSVCDWRVWNAKFVLSKSFSLPRKTPSLRVNEEEALHLIAESHIHTHAPFAKCCRESAHRHECKLHLTLCQSKQLFFIWYIYGAVIHPRN